MNVIFVAYDRFGDLVASAGSYYDLLNYIEYLGFEDYEVTIGKVTA